MKRHSQKPKIGEKPVAPCDTSDRISLTRDEWDFSSLPKEQVEQCFLWEFSRESEAVRKAVKRWRQQKRQPLPAWCKADDPEEARQLLSHSMPRIPRGIYIDRLEFPKQPWLSVPQPTRRQWLKDLPEIRKEGFQSITLRELPRNLQRILKYRFSAYAELVAFRIDWRLDNTELREQFRLWLKDHRPEDVKTETVKGKGSRVEQMRAGLKSLAALRLLRCMTWKIAEEASAPADADKPLFDGQSSWNRAKKRAGKILVQFASG